MFELFHYTCESKATVADLARTQKAVNVSSNRKVSIKVWRYSAELWTIPCNGLTSPWASSCSRMPNAIRAVIPRNNVANVGRIRINMDA